MIKLSLPLQRESANHQFPFFMLILLDPGHGLNTLGKRSPDGKFLEAIYNRDIAKRIVAELQNKGYDAELLVQESEDISLQERVRRTNELCQTLGKSNVILISIHVNAAGNGTQWMNATGWSCYTCKGQTQSDTLANCLYQAATKTSQASASELTILTTTLTGKKTSICSEKLYAWQYSAIIIIWITNLILSICRAKLESRLLSTLTLRASRNT